MKLIYVFTLLTILALSACNSEKKVSNEIALGDTIQTTSGLQYYYLKHGEGRIIEPGCDVGTYLSLMVNDSVVWNTDELQDSLFTFIAGYTSLIKGFTEAYWLLREGDEIVAIMPDSLAYGSRGAGDVVPPYATLVYDQFKIFTVSEPKGILADTLLHIFKLKGLDACIEKYKTITTSIDSTLFHIQNDQLHRFCDKLSVQEKFEDVINVANAFSEITGDVYLKIKVVDAYEAMGEIKLAKETLEVLHQADPTNPELLNKRKELEEKLK